MMNLNFPIAAVAAAAVAVLVAVAPLHAATVTVVSHYSLGESDPASGLTDSVSGHNMTLAAGTQATGSASPTGAGSTASESFDGSTYFQYTAAVLPGNSGTVPGVMIEAWVNPSLATLPDTNGDIIASNGHGGIGYGFYQDNNGSGGSGFGIFIGGDGATFWHPGSTVISAGTWYHLVLVGNTTLNKWQLYVNGNLDQTVSPGGTGGAAAYTAVGDQGSGGPFAFTGLVDDLYYSTYTGTFNAATDFQANPVPTPAALPAGLALLAISAIRRRRA